MTAYIKQGLGAVILFLALTLFAACGGSCVPDPTPTPSQVKAPRSATIIVEEPLELKIKDRPATGEGSQEREAADVTIPEVAVPSQPIPASEALEFVKTMKIGWNLGNTFDAHSEKPSFKDELLFESAWCGIKTTKAMMDALKKAGFNTLRIPVSWHNHVSGADFKISGPWLDRVQEVVDYAYANDMIVILNMHHDVSKPFYYPSSDCLESSKAYVTAVWNQLALRFRDYDEKLVFESVNEPRLVGTENEWWLDMGKDSCKDAVACINALNQTFVDTVRASGGNNATRYLMVPGYAAAADNALMEAFRLPADTAPGKLIVSVHAYTPYNFALQGPEQGGSVSDWSQSSPESTRDIDSFMERLYQRYVSQGIPVVIGEFGSRDKGGNLQARVDHAAYYIRSARARGMTCCWWDNNAFTGNGENFGLLDRQTVSWKYPELVSAMMKYAQTQ